MGFSFKENCPDFRNTGVLNLFNELKDFSCNLTVFDPLVDENRVFKVHKIKVHKEIPKKKFNAILIAVGHSCFKKMGLKKIKEYCYSNSVIFEVVNHSSIWDLIPSIISALSLVKYFRSCLYEELGE